MDGVGAVGDAERAHLGVHAGQSGVLAHTVSTVDLDGLVDDLECCPRGGDFDHGDVGLCGLEAFFVCHHCGEIAKLPALGDFDPRFRDRRSDHVLLGQDLAEGLSAMDAIHHGGQRKLGGAERPHAVVNSAWAESSLGNLKSPTLSQDHIAAWDPHVVEDDLCIVTLVAEDCERSKDVHAWRVAGHEDHGLLLVQGARKARSSQQDKDLALRSDGAGDPPLVAVDDVFVAVSLDSGADVGGIARGHAWFSHSEGGANFAV
mmetsp:Transcript_74481/g.155281  ORF Transcript_74481/g.155281 Transcript_74481/m.155281 type:complete len:260 (-) Transcript_74481:518-1297(-)